MNLYRIISLETFIDLLHNKENVMYVQQHGMTITKDICSKKLKT